ncbi:MAG: tetratricopeptide repeat protein [Phycisphaerae bacterium]
MRKSLLLSIILLAICTPALADVVYLTNGKMYEGVVTKKDGKVRIKLQHDTIEVPESQVITIVESEVKKSNDHKTSGSTGSTETFPDPLTGTVTTDPVPMDFSVATADRPEVAAYALMRQIMSTPAGEKRTELRESVQKWRVVAHDQKRRVGGSWIDPSEFIRRRKKYIERVGELESELRKLRWATDRSRTSQDKKRRQLLKIGGELRQAAQVWTDPAIRSFLTGLTYIVIDSHRQAEPFFRRAREDAPNVAGLIQGHAISLVEANRPKLAVEAAMEVLRLHPENKDAIELLQETMEKAPGRVINSDEYKAAKKLLAQYELKPRVSVSSSRGVRWLMPGKGWYARRGGMPTPSYDRLEFKQAVAVPVGKHTLLMDEAVLEGALEAYIEIKPGLFSPVEPRSSRYSSSRSQKPLPLRLVHVKDYEFVPTVDIKPQSRRTTQPAKREVPFEGNTTVTAYALGVFREMGTAMRTPAGAVKSVADTGDAEVSVSLLPGEAAGPVLTDKGKLVGFLAGRTSLKDQGGPHKLHGLGHILDVIERAVSSRSFRSHSRVERKVEPQKVEGIAFRVLVIHAERFEQ